MPELHMANAAAAVRSVQLQIKLLNKQSEVTGNGRAATRGHGQLQSSRAARTRKSAGEPAGIPGRAVADWETLLDGQLCCERQPQEACPQLHKTRHEHDAGCCLPIDAKELVRLRAAPSMGTDAVRVMATPN
jgi:hypothetical protein